MTPENKTDPLTLPFTLYPSKRKSRKLVIISIVFVCMAVFIAGPIGMICGLFFGVAGIVSLFMRRPKKFYLSVDGCGFEYFTPIDNRSYLWSDISEFGTYRYFPEARFGGESGIGVGFNFTPDYKGKITALPFSKFKAMLPDTYGYPAEELAKLLTRFHQEALKNKPAT